jgi:hypothetical protein
MFILFILGVKMWPGLHLTKTGSGGKSIYQLETLSEPEALCAVHVHPLCEYTTTQREKCVTFRLAHKQKV